MSKKQDNNTTDKNLSTLLAWYRIKRVNEFASQCDEDQGWEAIQKRIRRHKVRRIYTYCIGAAAACLLIISTGLYLLPTTDNDSLFEHTGSHKAVLAANGQSYNLLSQDESILNANGMQVAQNADYTLRYDTQKGRTKGSHVLDVPRGGEYKLVLSDGTRVHVNAESRLSYPASFAGRKREVHLTGEAFFEVAKDALHPFIVHTPNSTIEVMGTRFNVNTYEQDQTAVTLEEGSVKVYAGKEEDKAEKPVSLSPGEQAIVQPASIHMQRVQVAEYTSWANGIYEYTDTPLEVIVEQLSRWYDVDITFADPQLKKRRFAGVIFRNQPLQKAVDILSKISNVSFKQKGNTIEIIENHTNP